MVETRSSSADNDDPLHSFASRLQDLRASCGNPSIRLLEKLTKDMNSPYRRSTIQDKLSGKSKPDWIFVKTFVRACHKNAGKKGEPNLGNWRRLHLSMARKLANQENEGIRSRILCDLEEALSAKSREDILRIMRAAGVRDTDGLVPSPNELIARVTTLQQMVRLIDACITPHDSNRAHEDAVPETSAQAGGMVSPMVVFRSTGERALVTLPLDMDVRAAARHIVGEIFLRELPQPRRLAYVHNTVEWVLVHEGRSYENGTLRDAGIGDNSEISVRSYLGYQFYHDASQAMAIWDALDNLYESSPEHALGYDVVATLVERMGRGGDDLENLTPRRSSSLGILGLSDESNPLPGKGGNMGE